MARPRASTRPTAPHADPAVVQLRIDRRGPEDIVGSGKGFLLLYDPAIITPKLLERFGGLTPVSTERITRAANAIRLKDYSAFLRSNETTTH